MTAICVLLSGWAAASGMKRPGPPGAGPGLGTKLRARPRVVERLAWLVAHLRLDGELPPPAGLLVHELGQHLDHLVALGEPDVHVAGEGVGRLVARAVVLPLELQLSLRPVLGAVRAPVHLVVAFRRIAIGLELAPSGAAGGTRRRRVPAHAPLA